MMKNAVIIQEEDQIKEKNKTKKTAFLRGWGNVSSGALSDAIMSPTCKQLLYHLTIR